MHSELKARALWEWGLDCQRLSDLMGIGHRKGRTDKAQAQRRWWRKHKCRTVPAVKRSPMRGGSADVSDDDIVEAIENLSWKNCNRIICSVEGECSKLFANRTSSEHCCSDALYGILKDVVGAMEGQSADG